MYGICEGGLYPLVAQWQRAGLLIQVLRVKVLPVEMALAGRYNWV